MSAVSVTHVYITSISLTSIRHSDLAMHGVLLNIDFESAIDNTKFLHSEEKTCDKMYSDKRNTYIFVVLAIAWQQDLGFRQSIGESSGHSSYKPLGASYTAQEPQKQPELLKHVLVCY